MAARRMRVPDASDWEKGTSQRSLVDDIDKQLKDEEKRKEEGDRKLASDVGPNVFPSADIGEEVTVTWGADKYSPKQFNTIETPSFSRTTKVRPGETATDAMRRCYNEIKALAQESFDDKFRMFAKNYMRFAKQTDKDD